MLLVNARMSYLYLTVLFPLIGFILLAAGRDKLSENVAAVIGVGSVGLSALFALIAGMAFTTSGQQVLFKTCGHGSMLAVLRRALAYI